MKKQTTSEMAQENSIARLFCFVLDGCQSCAVSLSNVALKAKPEGTASEKMMSERLTLVRLDATPADIKLF